MSDIYFDKNSHAGVDANPSLVVQAPDAWTNLLKAMGMPDELNFTLGDAAALSKILVDGTDAFASDVAASDEMDIDLAVTASHVFGFFFPWGSNRLNQLALRLQSPTVRLDSWSDSRPAARHPWQSFAIEPAHMFRVIIRFSLRAEGLSPWVTRIRIGTFSSASRETHSHLDLHITEEARDVYDALEFVPVNGALRAECFVTPRFVKGHRPQQELTVHALVGEEWVLIDQLTGEIYSRARQYPKNKPRPLPPARPQALIDAMMYWE